MYGTYQDLLILIRADNICLWCTPRSSACYISWKRPENYYKEQEARGRRVQVAFQPKAWCDESIMKKWISEQWETSL